MPTTSQNGPRSLGRTGSKYLSARAKVLENNQICALCGELIDMDLEWPHPKYATVNHKEKVKDLPRNDPRLWDPRNLEPAHLDCNARDYAQNRKTVVEHPVSRDWRR